MVLFLYLSNANKVPLSPGKMKVFKEKQIIQLPEMLCHLWQATRLHRKVSQQGHRPLEKHRYTMLSLLARLPPEGQQKHLLVYLKYAKQTKS